jgi:hypothetical protein
MYLAVVILLLGVLPVVSILVDVFLFQGNADIVLTVGRWFVFWAVGIRLLMAGARQTLNPAYTAETIFGIRDPKAHRLVGEIGFGNLAMGTLGVVTIGLSGWLAPAALVGGLYYGLAGLGHLWSHDRNRTEMIALVSDIFIFLVLAGWLIAYFLSRQHV